jgi:hypothetical protein
MEKDYLTLERAPLTRLSREWKDDDYDVLADGEIVGRIFNAGVSVASPQRRSPNASGLHGRNSARTLGIRASFKGIFCYDTSEFESNMPSHAVWSLWAMRHRLRGCQNAPLAVQQ